MSTREQQRVGYWLTPAGCVAAGGHTPKSADSHTCATCGATVPEPPEEMLERAQERIATGADPQRLVAVAIAWRDKWGLLVEEQEAAQRAGHDLDGRTSIYTGETYAEARDRWEAYRVLLVDELRGTHGAA